ncbi:hypothetical protein [Pediococcus pentosaceus]|uniref:hypothetical protein n=1 Tax=Pediococcus pentosaceus TaxID=1255 RepID=UPI000D00954E|nr:hypothetical protein [Pediococcus pentosaceus]AVL02850.1 hypothetical protein PP40703_08625 [Pediococcus pentosaceus]MBF7133638.1 hypothetical protein [Pediococcus pentosaceus]QPT36974.1 hypothetical protein I6G30_03465 [Pediococcus pentosaceus]QYY85659.1 hypothetical protein GRI00_03580 [Pediococcus pentosaceus]
MKNIYIVKLGNLYVEQSETGFLRSKFYRMVNLVSGASLFEENDSKEIAEKIGGKAYKINLEEVEA